MHFSKLVVVALFATTQAAGQASATCLNEKPKDSTYSVKIGFWRNTGGGTLGDACNSCVGEPLIETFYPIADGSDRCFQWPGNSGKNSMKSGVCSADQSFTFNQWAGTCSCQGQLGAKKQIFKNRCVVDRPSSLCAMVVDYSACENGSFAGAPAPAPAPAPNSVFTASSSSKSGKKSKGSSKFNRQSPGSQKSKGSSKRTKMSTNSKAKTQQTGSFVAETTPASSSRCAGQSDLSNLCSSYASHCQSGKVYFTWMSQNCGKTCCATMPPPPADCSSKPDTHPQLCRAYASHCHAGQQYTPWMTANCLQTCCNQLSGQNTCEGTVDIASPNMCESYRSHCRNGERYFAWMSLNCTRTCCNSKL